MSRRQISLFVIVCGFIFEKLLVNFINKYDKDGCDKLTKAMTSWLGKIVTILVVILISLYFYRNKIYSKVVDDSTYPVAACDYIIENLDTKTMRIYNEYNYGSYLLYRGIPVFIDSRAELYTPQFNGVVGRDIFSDYINISNISTYYEDKFESYGITHVIVKRNAKLNMFLSRDKKYKQLYVDKYYVIYERTNNK